MFPVSSYTPAITQIIDIISIPLSPLSPWRLSPSQIHAVLVVFNSN